jgi:hypothetical protein
MALGTEAGVQLFTRGRLPASGGGVAGGAVIWRLGDGLLLGLAVGLGLAAVGRGSLIVASVGEGVRPPGFAVPQAAATISTTNPQPPAMTRRCRRARVMFRSFPSRPVDHPGTGLAADESHVDRARTGRIRVSDLVAGFSHVGGRLNGDSIASA